VIGPPPALGNDEQGIVGRIMYGVFIDVTERKKTEEAREMLVDEMNHRVKNILAITSALTTISSRTTMTKGAQGRKQSRDAQHINILKKTG
jgi:hypothetical protein